MNCFLNGLLVKFGIFLISGKTGGAEGKVPRRSSIFPNNSRPQACPEQSEGTWAGPKGWGLNFRYLGREPLLS